MKKILFVLPLFLVGCSYSWSSTTTSTVVLPKSTVTVSTGQTIEGSGIIAIQSGSTGTTTSKIIFEKDLSPSIRVVQDEENTTVFFRNQKIASRSNIINDTDFLEYQSIGQEITNILQSNEIEPEKFTPEQKKQFGRIYAQKYFLLLDNSEYTASGITILSHLMYEGWSDGWIFDENTGDMLTYTWSVGSTQQIIYQNNIWYILGWNERGDEGPYLDLYSANKNIRHILLEQLPIEKNVEYKQFEIVWDKQIKIWYEPRKLEEGQVTTKDDWKSYVISL